MSCNQSNSNFNIKTVGTCDVSKVLINGNDLTMLNWKQISVPEMLTIPTVKPDVENIDQISAIAEITSTKLIETPFSYTQMTNDPVVSNELLASILSILDAINIADLLTPLTDAVEAILAVPLLNTVPGIGPLLTSINSALTALENGVTDLTTAIADATAVLVQGVTTTVVTAALATVSSALELVESLVNDLLTAVDNLGDFVAAFPGVGPAVAALLGAVTTAADAIISAVLDALNSIIEILTQLPEVTTYFVLNPNAEGTILTGRKLIVEGTLKQKVVYTANVDVQSVHSANFEIPFTAFIIPYAKFEGLTYDSSLGGFVITEGEEITPDLCEEFSVEVCIEDIFACLLNERQLFKNVTLFLYAKPTSTCN